MTQDELQSKFTICAITGGLLRPNGQRAGTINVHGYRRIHIQGKNYAEHRLVWLYYHGEFPSEQIDHKNRDKTDNRIDNLRLATQSQNQQNRDKRKDNRSGYIGVYKFRNKWTAQITIDGKQIHLGTFNTKEEAIFARKEAELKYHPFKVV